MGYSEEDVFVEQINKIKEPIEKLHDILSNERMSLSRVKWDTENKRNDLGKLLAEIELQKQVQENIKKDNEALKEAGTKEKDQIISEGLRFINEAQSLLKNVKGFIVDAERKHYEELSHKTDSMAETAQPRKVGRPPKEKAAA